MDTSALHGVIPIVPTPFDGDGDLDLVSLERLVGYLIGTGVHGLAVLGMASEVYSLSEDERDAVIETAAATLDGRIPLVAGCSHNSGPAVARLAAEAAKRGADVLMVMPPAMGDPPTEVIRDYYAAAAGATDLPIMIQDNPSWTGVRLPTSFYLDLCSLESVQYAKIETRHPPTTISAVRGLVGDRLFILGGQAGNWLPEELARGVVGTMPAAIMPEVYVRVWELWVAGEDQQARAVFRRYHDLIRVTGTPGVGIPMSKKLLADLGIISSPTVRAPLARLTEQDCADLEAVTSELNLASLMRRGAMPDIAGL